MPVHTHTPHGLHLILTLHAVGRREGGGGRGEGWRGEGGGGGGRILINKAFYLK